MGFQFNQRRRGVLAVRADGNPLATAIGELNGAFSGFRDDIDGRMAAVEAAVDQLNADGAARRVGPLDGGPRSPADRAAAAGLERYIRTGDASGIRAAMSTDSNPDGGYTVTPWFADTVTTTIKPTTPMRLVARVVPISSGNTYQELASPERPESGWVGEREERPETQQGKLALMEIVVFEQYANPATTQNLLDDSQIDVAAWLAGEVAGEFSLKENAAFVAGTGVMQPRGFLTYPTSAEADGTRPWGTIQYVPSGDASGLPATDPGDALFNLQATLKSGYAEPVTAGDPLSGAVWMMNRTTRNVVRKLKDGQGNYLWAMGNIAEMQPETLLGYPLVVAEDMPDIAANAFPIAFGNWRRSYTIVDRQGVRVLRDAFTNKPYVHFYTTKRVGGAVNNYEGIKLLKIATS